MTRGRGLTGVLLATVLFFGVAVPSQDRPAGPARSSGALTIPAGQKFILRLDTPIHTKSTRKGDRVELQTAADVLSDNRVVIPDGSRVRATVTKAKRAGRIAGRAEVQLHLDDVRLADGSVLPLRASILRVGFSALDAKGQGEPPIKGDGGSGGGVGTVVKGGAQGAIIGVLGAGGKGAMYGSAVGAGVALAGMVLRRGPDLDLPRDTMIEARFDSDHPVSQVAVDRAALAAPEPSAPRASDIGGVRDLSTVPRPILRRNEPAPTAADNPQPDPAPVPQPPAPPTHGAQSPAVVVPAPPPPVEATVAVPPPTVPSRPTETVQPVPDPAGFKLSVNVRMVVVDAVVRDRAGRMMDNLTRQDFRVMEDGAEQALTLFSRDELPLAVALVVDRSGSVGPYIDELRRIAERTLDRLKPEDRVALFSFAGSVDRVVDLTADRREIARGLSRIRTGGGTNIVDALFDATVYLARVAPENRRAVILVSDNQATVRPQQSEPSTIRMAMESETVVYSLKTSGEGPPLALRLPSLLEGAGSAAKVARETGGEVFDVSKVGMLDSALSSVLSRLRMRYSLGYYPPDAGRGGAFHSIEIALREGLGKPGKDYSIIARRGYYSVGDRNRPSGRVTP